MRRWIIEVQYDGSSFRSHRAWHKSFFFRHSAQRLADRMSVSHYAMFPDSRVHYRVRREA